MLNGAQIVYLTHLTMTSMKLVKMSVHKVLLGTNQSVNAFETLAPYFFNQEVIRALEIRNAYKKTTTFGLVNALPNSNIIKCSSKDKT